MLDLRGQHGNLRIIGAYFDPASKLEQKRSVEMLKPLITKDCHCIVCGDFTFVMNQHDRISKSDAHPSDRNDLPVATVWRDLLSSSLTEWEQPEMTCESSLSFSRVDRVYTNLGDAECAACVQYFLDAASNPKTIGE